jgi:hypothetical protein
VHNLVYATPTNVASPDVTLIDVDGAPSELVSHGFMSTSANPVLAALAAVAGVPVLLMEAALP